MSTSAPRIRSLYRNLLRELPPRKTRSPLQSWMRERFIAAPPPPPPTASGNNSPRIPAIAASTVPSGTMHEISHKHPASSSPFPSSKYTSQPPNANDESYDIPSDLDQSTAPSAAVREMAHRHERHTSPPPGRTEEQSAGSIEEVGVPLGEQLLSYLRAQRTYVALLERYNPGMGMDEEERVRLTARRVGMDLPVEFRSGGNGSGSGSSGGEGKTR